MINLRRLNKSTTLNSELIPNFIADVDFQLSPSFVRDLGGSLISVMEIELDENSYDDSEAVVDNGNSQRA